MPDLDLSPSRYIDKISRATGKVVDEPIRPCELLVHDHRDHHVVEILGQCLMSWTLAATGDEKVARRRVRHVRRLGHAAVKGIVRLTRGKPARVARVLFGLKDREHYLRFKPLGITRERAQQVRATVQQLAAQKLAAVTSSDGRRRLCLLLTGGTGFLGKEILWQAAHDPDIAEVIVLIRPKEARDIRTGPGRTVRSAEERGDELLRQLWPDEPPPSGKFRVMAGDIEQPGLGFSAPDLSYARRHVTHVIHGAARVAFDDPYETAFRTNVGGTLNALAFSHALQDDPASPFVAHLAIESSYIHGRQVRLPAREEEIVFPRGFYNNYYELTKAMASLESERAMLGQGLRVVQLCPAIIVGHARTGNNRGDTKVVNAPVNFFGLAKQALECQSTTPILRTSLAPLVRMAFLFPGDATAEFNLIPVDRVVNGIFAALKKPLAVGCRIHLATDNRLSSRDIQQILAEEFGVHVRLAEPSVYRNLTLPVVTRVLRLMNHEKIGRMLRKLGTVFAGYGDWGQPVHEVGRDVSILGLPVERPVTSHVFRMLCRHNEWVQEFGRVRDPYGIARREKTWAAVLGHLERETGTEAAAIPPSEFRRMVASLLDRETFQLTNRTASASRSPSRPPRHTQPNA